LDIARTRVLESVGHLKEMAREVNSGGKHNGLAENSSSVVAHEVNCINGYVWMAMIAKYSVDVMLRDYMAMDVLLFASPEIRSALERQRLALFLQSPTPTFSDR
jgi:hypothetical protein